MSHADTRDTLEEMRAYVAQYGFTNLSYTTGQNSWVYSDQKGVYAHLYPDESQIELTAVDGLIKSATGRLGWPNRNLPAFLKQLDRHRPAEELADRPPAPQPDELARTQARLNTLASNIVKRAADAGLIDRSRKSVTGRELDAILDTLSERAKQGQPANVDEPLQLVADPDNDAPAPSN